jgi:hypothetical protein
MPQFAAPPLRWVNLQFTDEDGNPLAGGKVYSYEAGTSTAAPLYTDVDYFIPYSNPIILGDDGRPSGAVFMLPQGYKIEVYDADDVLQYTLDDISDPGAVFAENFGIVMSEGGKEQASGYEVQTDDRLVTMDSTGGADPCLVNLPASADATQQVTIKNLGTEPLAVTPNGDDTIEGIADPYTVPAAATPVFPSITLVPDGVSGWWIVASHGL